MSQGKFRMLGVLWSLGLNKHYCVAEAWICVTCGTQFEPTQRPPSRCDICDEERQWVGNSGRQELCWTTTEELRHAGFPGST